MNELHLANNLVRLRRERKVTQEELAAFITAGAGILVCVLASVLCFDRKKL